MVRTKIFSALTTLFAILTVTFFIMKIVPGDPFLEEKAIPEEILRNMRAHYGLNDPLWQQYLRYLWSAISLNLGPSFTYPGRTVNEIIAEGFPISALLGLEALCIACPLGVMLGCMGALYPKGSRNVLFMVLITIGTAIPSFVMAALLQYGFAIRLEWFPIARWGSFAHTVLPALSLAMLPTAFIARLLRASMIKVLASDYIRAARARGLSESAILWKHALRNSLLPVISYLGPLTASIITGTFVVERIFSIPGLGQWWIESITSRDYTVIFGITLFYSVVLLALMLLVDIVYVIIDPRIATRGTIK